MARDLSSFKQLTLKGWLSVRNTIPGISFNQYGNPLQPFLANIIDYYAIWFQLRYWWGCVWALISLNQEKGLTTFLIDISTWIDKRTMYNNVYYGQPDKNTETYPKFHSAQTYGPMRRWRYRPASCTSCAYLTRSYRPAKLYYIYPNKYYHRLPETIQKISSLNALYLHSWKYLK